MALNNKILTVVSLAIALFAANRATADEAPLAGTWKLTTDMAGVHRERNCSFVQKGASFSGVCKNDDGAVSVTGTVTGDKVTFQYDADVFGQKVNSVCAGKISGSNVVGSLTLPAFGLDGDCSVVRTGS